MKKNHLVIIGGLVVGLVLLTLFLSQILFRPAGMTRPEGSSIPETGSATLQFADNSVYPDIPRIILNNDANRSYSLDLFLYDTNRAVLRQENIRLQPGELNHTNILVHIPRGTYYLKFTVDNKATYEFPVDTTMNFMFVLYPDGRIGKEISGFDN